jgi:hypothetical protein
VPIFRLSDIVIVIVRVIIYAVNLNLGVIRPIQMDAIEFIFGLLVANDGE